MLVYQRVGGRSAVTSTAPPLTRHSDPVVVQAGTGMSASLRELSEGTPRWSKPQYECCVCCEAGTIVVEDTRTDVQDDAALGRVLIRPPAAGTSTSSASTARGTT